ncbi:hypothetical protein ACHQM5_029776 [Ranunculus cassubicifolius]
MNMNIFSFNSADIFVKLRENKENEVLASWSGYPCLPLAWHGVRCHPSENGSMVITHLDLSSSGLQGSLPPVITEVPHSLRLSRENSGGGSHSTR